jgi:hypothetical protein
MWCWRVDCLFRCRIAPRWREPRADRELLLLPSLEYRKHVVAAVEQRGRLVSGAFPFPMNSPIHRLASARLKTDTWPGRSEAYMALF